MNDIRALMVMTHLPDQDSAEQLAEHLVTARLAACINIQAPCISYYAWQGVVERSQEVAVHIKTTPQQLEAVIEAIRHRHPYELPDIVYVHLDGGEPRYFQWLHTQTTP